MKNHNFFYFIGEGVRGIFLHGLMSFVAIGVIMACLLIMGSFALVAVNMEATLSDLEKENQIIAYVDDSLSEEEARALQSQIEKVDNVASCQFVTREEAMKEFLSQYEDDSVFASVPASVLRDRYEIHLTDIEQMETTVQTIRAVDGVADVRAELDIAKGFMTVRNMAGIVAGILAVMLLLVSLFIISNTIRLAAFTRREEVAIMKMCGATDSFVRWPFVCEGVILGLLGAVVAFFLQWGVYELVVRAVTASDTLRLLDLLPFSQLAGRVAAAFAAIGFIIGTAGSTLAIGKFLKV
jgi:cell division transport system permease protein